MSTLVIPNTFVTGTTIESAPFNSNFAAIQTWSSNIDNTNLGALGIYASQIIPTSAAQALVGGLFGIAGQNATGQVNLGYDGASGASIYLGAAGTNFTPASSTQPFKFTNAANTVNNFEILDAGGVMGNTSASTTLSYLPPVYTAAGAAVASTAHIVIGSFVGTGAGVNITLSGAAAFSSQFSYTIYGATYFTASGSLLGAQAFNQVSGTLITCGGSATTTTTTWIAIGT